MGNRCPPNPKGPTGGATGPARLSSHACLSVEPVRKDSRLSLTLLLGLLAASSKLTSHVFLFCFQRSNIPDISNNKGSCLGSYSAAPCRTNAGMDGKTFGEGVLSSSSLAAVHFPLLANSQVLGDEVQGRRATELLVSKQPVPRSLLYS